MVHTSEYIYMQVIITKTFVCFKCKRSIFEFFSVEILSLRVVVTIGRNDSKSVLLGGILSARLEPTFIKKIIERLSVISLLINKFSKIYKINKI